MPNTPCLVQEGAGIFCRGTKATQEDVVLMKSTLSVIFPVLEEITQTQFNAATALSGSGPAYVSAADSHTPLRTMFLINLRSS